MTPQDAYGSRNEVVYSLSTDIWILTQAGRWRAGSSSPAPGDQLQARMLVFASLALGCRRLCGYHGLSSIIVELIYIIKLPNLGSFREGEGLSELSSRSVAVRVAGHAWLMCMDATG